MRASCNSTYRLRYWNARIYWNVVSLFHLQLQQYLPFTVLKRANISSGYTAWCIRLQQYLPFTVLKQDSNIIVTFLIALQQYLPFTVLKPHIIRVKFITTYLSCNSTYRLRYWNPQLQRMLWYYRQVATVPTVYGIETIPFNISPIGSNALQQYLPFTVLKPHIIRVKFITTYLSCNSTYRLRYAPKGARRQRSEETMKSAHFKCLNEVKVKQRW